MTLTEKQIGELNKIFESANVSLETKDFWISRLHNTTKDFFELVLVLFGAYPEMIEWYKKIQTRKENALMSRDHESWQKIIEEEKQKLEQIL